MSTDDVAVYKGGSEKIEKIVDVRTEEELKKIYEQYSSSNWGYTGRTEVVVINKKEFKVKKFPSGSVYLVARGGQLIKMDNEFFERMKRELKNDSAQETV